MSDMEKAFESILDQLAANVAERIRTAGMPHPKRLFTLEEAAEYTGLTEAAIRVKVAAGKMPVVRVDRKFRFDVEDLNRWIESSKQVER